MPLPSNITRLLAFLLSTETKSFNESSTINDTICLIQALHTDPVEILYKKITLTTRYAVAAHLLEILSDNNNPQTSLTLCGPQKIENSTQATILLLCQTGQLEWNFSATTEIGSNYLQLPPRNLILKYFAKKLINPIDQDIFEADKTFPLQPFEEAKYFVLFKFLQIPFAKLKTDPADKQLAEFFKTLQKKQEILISEVLLNIFKLLPNLLFDAPGIQIITELARKTTNPIDIDKLILEKLKQLTPLYRNRTTALMLFNLIQDSTIKLDAFQLPYTSLELNILSTQNKSEKNYSKRFAILFQELLLQENIPHNLHFELYQIYWEKANIYDSMHPQIFETFFRQGLPPNTPLILQNNQPILQFVFSTNFPADSKLIFLQLCIGHKNNIANPNERDQFFLNTLKTIIANPSNTSNFDNSIMARILFNAFDQDEFKVKSLQFIFQELMLSLQRIYSPANTTTIPLAEFRSQENQTSLLRRIFTVLLKTTKKDTLPIDVLNSFYQSYWTTLSQTTDQIQLLRTHLKFLSDFFACGLPVNTPISHFNNQTILQRCAAKDIVPQLSQRIFLYVLEGCQTNRKNIPDITEHDQFFFTALEFCLKNFNSQKNYGTFQTGYDIFLFLASSIIQPTIQLSAWKLLLSKEFPMMFYLILIDLYHEESLFYSRHNNFIKITKTYFLIAHIIFRLLTSRKLLNNTFITYLGELQIEKTLAKQMILNHIATLNPSDKKIAYLLATEVTETNLYDFFHTPRGILSIQDNDLIAIMVKKLCEIRQQEQPSYEETPIPIAATSSIKTNNAASSSESTTISFSDFFKKFSLSTQHSDTTTKPLPLTAENSEEETEIELTTLTINDSEEDNDKNLFASIKLT